MKKLFTLLLCLSSIYNPLEIKAQTTFRIFDSELFIDGYANGQLAKYNDSLPPSAGVVRLRTSLVTKKITNMQLASIGNNLSMKVLVKASCDNYDRGGHVSLALVPKGNSTYDPDSVKRFEIARFITPFMNKNKKPDTVPYYYEINNIASILREKSIIDSFDVWCELEIFGVPYAANTEIAGCANRADVFFGTLDFTTNSPQAIETNNILLTLGNQLNFNNYNASATDIVGQTVRTIPFTLATKSYHTKIHLITSNHGAGSGGEEYNRRFHYVFVDGTQVLSYMPGFESCEPYRKYNTQANGIYGSSPRTDEQWQSFSNWCPGAYIPPRIIYLGTLEAGNHSFKIEVPDAVFVGADGNFPLSVYIQGKTEQVTGVKDADNLMSSALLYPNPANGQHVSIVSESEVTQYAVYNTIGKEVLNGFSSDISIENLNDGMYYVRIFFANGQYIVKPLVKE